MDTRPKPNSNGKGKKLLFLGQGWFQSMSLPSKVFKQKVLFLEPLRWKECWYLNKLKYTVTRNFAAYSKCRFPCLRLGTKRKENISVCDQASLFETGRERGRNHFSFFFQARLFAPRFLASLGFFNARQKTGFKKTPKKYLHCKFEII